MNKLQNPAIRTEYENHLRGKVNGRNGDEKQQVHTMWEKVRENIKSTADEIVGTDRARPKNQWFDEDCEIANREENEA